MTLSKSHGSASCEGEKVTNKSKEKKIKRPVIVVFSGKINSRLEQHRVIREGAELESSNIEAIKQSLVGFISSLSPINLMTGILCYAESV